MALIITMIVLLILAGVVINLSLGENGIIGKAKTAVDKYKQTSQNEQIELAKIENLVAGNRTFDMDDLKAAMLEIVYPVGSIYTSKENRDPGNFLGGTWQRIAQGRVLMGASDVEADGFVAGTTKNAGLPNITGTFGARGIGDDDALGASPITHGNGAFQYSKNNGDLWGGMAYYGQSHYRVMSFDASRSNSIYGASNTVQPPAYVVYMWERIE